jgi:toluene monooxygenase electron transfer component
VMEFQVVLADPITYDAGQFAVLEVPGVQGGRAYSMVNFETGTDRVTFVVKQKPGGRFCDWLFQDQATGAQANFFGPLGRATFKPAEGRNILCIAGGSGIAGMLAILEHARRENYYRQHTGHLYFGVRTLADGFYLEQLADYVSAGEGGLEVTLALSHEQPATDRHPQFPGIRLSNGMVADVAAQSMAGRFENLVGFVAGPPPMVDGTLRFLLRDARIPPQYIRYDKFA